MYQFQEILVNFVISFCQIVTTSRAAAAISISNHPDENARAPDGQKQTVIRLIQSPCGMVFSNITNKAMAPIQVRFIKPLTNNSVISMQQQPRQKTPWRTPVRTGPSEPGRQWRTRKAIQRHQVSRRLRLFKVVRRVYLRASLRPRLLISIRRRLAPDATLRSAEHPCAPGGIFRRGHRGRFQYFHAGLIITIGIGNANSMSPNHAARVPCRLELHRGAAALSVHL